MLKLIVDSSRLTPEQYLEAVLGNLRYIYYAYVDRFHIEPVDMIDLVDGILYIEAMGYREKRQLEDIQHQAKAGK